jgi:hypothetical protein
MVGDYNSAVSLSDIRFDKLLGARFAAVARLAGVSVQFGFKWHMSVASSYG